MKLLLDREVGRAGGPRPAERMYYGWIMLPLAMAGFIATSPGQTFGVSIFNEPIRASLGLTHGQLAAAYTLGTLAAAFPLACVGALMDRHGLRRTMTFVIVAFGLACLFTSAAANWFMLWAAFFLMRLLGPGALALTSANTLAYWFHRRLGLAEGIRQVGMALAMAVVPAVNLWMLERFDWRGSYALFGLLVCVVLLPLMAFVYRERPEEVGQSIDGMADDDRTARGSRARVNEQSGAREPRAIRPDEEQTLTLGEAVRTRSFWIVCSGTSLFGLIHTGVFFCIVPIFTDQGLGEAAAAGMLTVFAVSLATTQLLGGVLADRVRPTRMLPVALAGLAGSLFLLERLSHSATAHACGVAMGVSQGLFFAASNPLWARYFGRPQLGRIRGTVSTINIGAASLGPLLLGVCRDVTGSYGPMLTLFALLPLPLIGLSCFATPPLRQTATSSVAEIEGVS